MQLALAGYADGDSPTDSFAAVTSRFAVAPAGSGRGVASGSHPVSEVQRDVVPESTCIAACLRKGGAYAKPKKTVFAESSLYLCRGQSREEPRLLGRALEGPWVCFALSRRTPEEGQGSLRKSASSSPESRELRFKLSGDLLSCLRGEARPGQPGAGSHPALAPARERLARARDSRDARRLEDWTVGVVLEGARQGGGGRSILETGRV